MEIITIVTGGEVTHSDSMGNIYTLKAGDVQAMSAGTGVQHSESNKSPDTPLELFQLWISPKERDIEPRYQQKSYDFASVKNSIIFLVRENSLPINQDAYIAYGALDSSFTILYNLHDKQNGVYVFVIEGSISIGDQKLERRDAAGVSETDSIEILGSEDASFLIIEVPWE
jgi:redox-sensitive bicupin YhaK (pirin superfamily)